MAIADYGNTLSISRVRAVLDGEVENLGFAFVWADSPEGDAFWRKQESAGVLSDEGRRILEAIVAEAEPVSP